MQRQFLGLDGFVYNKTTFWASAPNVQHEPEAKPVQPIQRFLFIRVVTAGWAQRTRAVLYSAVV